MKATRIRRGVATGALSALAVAAATVPAWAQEDGEPAATAPESATTDATASPSTAAGDREGRDRDRRRLGDRTLREGMRGTDVRQLQKVLTELGFETRVSGSFDRRTERSDRRYERWKEDRVNGVVHRQQAERMKELVRRGARYRRHVFPVRGPHDYGGEGSRFGAPRSGHTHQGQDIAAASGTRLVSVHEGRVSARAYQDGGAGHYLVIRGRDGSDSVYMHMLRRPKVAPGERVMAGQTIGKVGSTGSSTGPHLHFELWTPHWYDGGAPYDPLPKLRKWDRRT